MYVCDVVESIALSEKCLDSHDSATTYQFDILQLVAFRSFDIFLLSHMRHVAPVVRAVSSCRRSDGAIVDEPIGTSTVDHKAEVIDMGLVRGVPAQVNASILLRALSCDTLGQRTEEKEASEPRHHIALPESSKNVRRSQNL